jgi:hypothetical protein
MSVFVQEGVLLFECGRYQGYRWKRINECGSRFGVMAQVTSCGNESSGLAFK